MANLPESAVYDAGVYQLETTDPVQGGASGVSNAPLKNLANRTTYLKQRVDNIESGATDLPGYAKLASPTFTGNPSAPTPPLGDNDTSIATTAFVQATLGGRLSKSVAGSGSITLTAVEAGSGILELTGALTGNRTVILPVTPTRSWIIKNATSGAFTLTVKTAAGTGVVVTQGTNAIVWTDGTNVYDALTDFDSPVLTGNPTAPTPAQFDNDTSLATTAWVNSRGVEFSDYRQITDTNATLTAADCGKLIQVSSAAGNLTITLPQVSSVPQRAVLTIVSTATNPVTLAVQGVDQISANGAAISYNKLRAGDCVTLVAAPSNTWIIAGGTMGLRDSALFGASLAAAGYQKLPSGLIIQWGAISLNINIANNYVSQSFSWPIAFPNAVVSVAVGPNDGIQSNGFTNYEVTSRTNSGAQLRAASSAAIGVRAYTYIAIGY